MSDHEPLPPDLAVLFEKEREGYTAFGATQADAYAKVRARIALTATASTANAAATPTAAKATAAGVSMKVVGAVAVASLAAGVVAGRVTAPDRIPAPAPVVSVTASASVSIPESPPPLREAPTIPSTTTETPPQQATSATSKGTLAQERALVEGARSALARGRPADALVAADRHAKEFPRGQLVEEREVLAITALISLGRTGEAGTRRVAFFKKFPNSLLVPPLVDGGS